MWWSRRHLILAALAAVLPACGFQPVHGTGGSLARFAGVTAVEAPATDTGYLLRRELVDRLGPASAPRYVLAVDLDIRDAAVGVTTEQVTTRYNRPGAASFVLRDLQAGTRLAEGRVDTFTSYSATGTSVSTFSAAEDAQARLATALADLILLRLAAIR